MRQSNLHPIGAAAAANPLAARLFAASNANSTTGGSSSKGASVNG